MTTDPKDLPLTDPREIRKLLTEVAYTGRRIDGANMAERISIAQSLVRRCRDMAQSSGLSGEDAMTLLAYHALLGYEKTMDLLLEEARTRPIGAYFMVTPKAD
mgnify:CR=1 FL=1|jgi:hypothetical protein